MEPGLSIRTFYQPTVILALVLLAIIVMMVLPMPAWMLDLGLAISFALAILIFTVTLFIERPLDFSAFPTVLLASISVPTPLSTVATKSGRKMLKSSMLQVRLWLKSQSQALP